MTTTPAAPPAELAAEARRLGVTLDAPACGQLAAFAALLEKWNARFNLLSRRDLQRLWPRHVLDSLSALPWLRGATVLDVGSGGGFPGVPLAIACPSRLFTLLDRHARKCRFLEQVVFELGLDNVTVRCADLTDLAREPFRRFDTIVSRAVAPPAEICASTGPLLADQGRQVVLAAAAGQSASAPPGAQVVPVIIPGLDQPHELVIMDRDSGAVA